MRDWIHKLQLTGALALGSVPVAAMLFAYTVPELLDWAWVYPAAYLLLTAIGIRIPGKWRLLYGILGMLLPVVGGFALAGDCWLPVLGANLFYGGLFLGSLTMGRWPLDWELPALPRIMGFVLHLAGQLVLFSDGLKPEPVLGAWKPWLRLCFLGYILLTVLSMNRDSMNNASDEKRSVSQGMRRKNTVMTLGLFGLAMLASLIPYIYDWIKQLVLWVVMLILRLLAFLTPEQQTGGPPSSGAEPEGLGPMEETEPSLLARILEIVAMVLAAIAVLALLVFLAVWLFKRVKRLLKRLWGLLERYAAAVSEDYQDEITDTRMDSDGQRISGSRRQRLRKTDRKGPMNPGEDIRHRYQRLLRRHRDWTPDTTARENIPEEMAALYEQARYSHHAPTEAEAEQFRSGTKGL